VVSDVPWALGPCFPGATMSEEIRSALPAFIMLRSRIAGCPRAEIFDLVARVDAAEELDVWLEPSRGG